MAFCHGDCDEDSDCQDDLICFHNENAANVPYGCQGTATLNWDYCYAPEGILCFYALSSGLDVDSMSEDSEQKGHSFCICHSIIDQAASYSSDGKQPVYSHWVAVRVIVTVTVNVTAD